MYTGLVLVTPLNMSKIITFKAKNWTRKMFQWFIKIVRNVSLKKKSKTKTALTKVVQKYLKSSQIQRMTNRITGKDFSSWGWAGPKVPETNGLVQMSSHGMELPCRVRNKPLVPHFRKRGRSPPGLVMSVPVEEFGGFHKLGGIAVCGSCSAWKSVLLLFKAVELP